MDSSVFRNKKILITGHTGFKGSWLTLWLLRSGASITGYALPPKTNRDNFVLTGLSNKINQHIADIRDKDKLFKVFNDEQPEIIFHLAAQPLVIESYKNPLYTYETNILGTANVLEAFRLTDSAKLLVVITSDKVYENYELSRGYNEDDRFGGKDPYSASKACAELISNAYNQSYFLQNKNKKCVTVRAGNVIGGGDWSENRIIPDCIQGLEKDEAIIIRNANSTRPWQYVLEPLGGYILLAERILKAEDTFTGGWNFGPIKENNINVEAIVKLVIDHYGVGNYVIKTDANQVKESKYLALDINKSMSKLKWKPCLDINETIHFTVDWYKNYKDVNLFDFCNKQIDEYEKKCKFMN